MESYWLESLDIDTLDKGVIHRLWIKVLDNEFGAPICVPVLVARGTEDGPTVGLTAAIHGNELNGMFAIQSLFQELAPEQLKGTVIGVPIMNVPSFMQRKRFFPDGFDLNRVMPGKKHSRSSSVYAMRLISKIINEFDYLLDLHTASFGRVNSFYIRANLKNDNQLALATCQNAPIILHKKSGGTLRRTANDLGIEAITVELGDPQCYQPNMVQKGVAGIKNTLVHLKMTQQFSPEQTRKPILCYSSEWLYTTQGGILKVYPEVTDFVEKGDLLAEILDPFGQVQAQVCAPYEGVVIGKSSNPTNMGGGRIIHLGRQEE